MRCCREIPMRKVTHCTHRLTHDWNNSTGSMKPVSTQVVAMGLDLPFFAGLLLLGLALRFFSHSTAQAQIPVAASTTTATPPFVPPLMRVPNHIANG